MYRQNQELFDGLEKLRLDVDQFKDVANKARATYDKLRKERDFHRMHHKRVVHEKNKLISDIKRLKKHYEHYEPTLKQLQSKYEATMKEKMLLKLERDRLNGKVTLLESNVKHLESRQTTQNGDVLKNTNGMKSTSNNETNSVAPCNPVEEVKKSPKTISLGAKKVGSIIQITIADNGYGITEEFQPNLFELLSTTKQTGMGLGLWLCKHIITRQNVNIFYEDNEIGAKFVIELPEAR